MLNSKFFYPTKKKHLPVMWFSYSKLWSEIRIELFIIRGSLKQYWSQNFMYLSQKTKISYITPHVERREALSQKFLPKKILAKMSLILDRPLKGPEKRDAPSALGSFPSYLSKDEKQRCYMCRLDGKPSNKLGYVQTQCCACAKGACKDHHHILCKPCAKSFIDGARDEARATELRTWVEFLRFAWPQHVAVPANSISVTTKMW